MATQFLQCQMCFNEFCGNCDKGKDCRVCGAFLCEDCEDICQECEEKEEGD